MKANAFKYILIYTSIYLLLAFVEVFLLSSLYDFLGNDFWIRFIAYTITFLLINPFITALIGKMFIKLEVIDDDGDM